MAYSYNERTAADSSDDTYSYTFPKIALSHVKCRLNGVELVADDATNGFVASSGSVQLGSAVTISSGDVVRVWRDTPSGALVDFQDGQVVREKDLDNATLQALYRALEAWDRALDLLPTGGAAGSVLRKTSTANYDVQWDDALAASYAQFISSNGTSAWSGTESVTWATARVAQHGIAETDTEAPLGSGNSIEVLVAGDYVLSFDVSAEHTNSSDAALSAIAYHKPFGGTWSAMTGTYFPRQGVAGAQRCQVTGSLSFTDCRAGDKFAVILAPSDSPTNWDFVDKGCQASIQRIA